MIDSHELKCVHEQHFLELVGNTQFVAAVAWLQLVVTNADVFVRVGLIPHRRRDPVAHLTATHEVGDELESGSIPREEIGTGRRFAIELGDRKHRGACCC